MGNPDSYEITAVRYATSRDRYRFQNCIHCAADAAHETMPMDFYVWVIRNAQRTIVVDTGSKEWKCIQRGHRYLRDPVAGLRAVGVDPARVEDVVVTHLHWDHAGNVDLFANATAHLTLTEMRMATGPDMALPAVGSVYLADDVCTIVRRLFEDKVRFGTGEVELASGITLHEVGGHAAGMQIVRVHTARGWVVLASDATHFYMNMAEANPFPILHDMHATLRGYARCLELADSPDHVIPGHDPAVLRRYPPASASLEGDAVRLDLDPVA